MGYINSNNIIVFPSSNRTNGNNYGTNWLTEYNLSNIINQLLGEKGFVISDSTDGDSFKFNIQGYYIEIKKLDNDGTVLDTLKKVAPEGNEETPIIDNNCTLIYFRRNGNDIIAGLEFAGGSPYGFDHLRGGDEEEVGKIPTGEKGENELVLCDSEGVIPVGSRIKITHLLDFLQTPNNTVTFGPTGSMIFDDNGKVELKSNGNITFGPTGAIQFNGNGSIKFGSNGVLDLGESGTLKGTINASNANISGPTITGGSITNTTVSGATITGSTFTGNINNSTITNGYLSGNIGPTGPEGATLNNMKITGATISSSTFSGTINTSTINSPTISTPTITGGTISGVIISGTNTISGTNSVKGDLAPAGGGNITATKITDGSKTITAKTSDKENIGILFQIDDGDLT